MKTKTHTTGFAIFYEQSQGEAVLWPLLEFRKLSPYALSCTGKDNGLSTTPINTLAPNIAVEWVTLLLFGMSPVEITV